MKARRRLVHLKNPVLHLNDGRGKRGALRAISFFADFPGYATGVQTRATQGSGRWGVGLGAPEAIHVPPSAQVATASRSLTWPDCLVLDISYGAAPGNLEQL